MKQIIAMGDHGLSTQPEDELLSRYILAQAEGGRPRVCYLAQAGGESQEYLLRFYRTFSRLDARPSHLSLFFPHTADLEDFLLDQAIIYVGGGNTRSLLALWRAWGLDAILRRAWEQEVVLAGPSAGAICWFEQGLTDSVPGRLGAIDGLGFLPGSCCPHYDGESERRPAYHRMVAGGEMGPGYGLDEHAALHFVGSEVARVVAARESAAVYRVEPDAGGVRETRLQARYLGATQNMRSP